MSKTIYPEGIIVFNPHEKAPDFVKGALIISLNKFVQFCKDNPELLSEYKGEKQLRCQILQGDKGLYVSVDTYKHKEDNKKNDTDNGNNDLPF